MTSKSKPTSNAPGAMTGTLNKNVLIEDKTCCDEIFASSCCLAMERIGGHVVTFMERGFYKLAYSRWSLLIWHMCYLVLIVILIHLYRFFVFRLGVAVGKYPQAFIIGVILSALAMLPGIVVPGQFFEETDPLNLWTPYGIKARLCFIGTMC